jgi:membrane associated rhomboid family serine protease
MILTVVAEMITSRIPTRSKREAMDWSLVLVSQGIETTIVFSDEAGWELAISEHEVQRARGVLQLYQAENRQWPWRQRIASRGVLFDWGSLAWVILICFFFWLQTHQTHLAIDLRVVGLMDAAAVSRGEWWRLFTAIFLHADIGHLAMNASLGLLLLGLTMGSLGTGVGLLAASLAGVGGNLIECFIYREGHRSLGASGMVMGCVGLLAVQTFSIKATNRNTPKRSLSGFLAGVMLLVLLGFDPSSDVVAHIGGFGSGLVLGALMRMAPRVSQSKAANVFAGLIFCLLVVCPWWWALYGDTTMQPPLTGLMPPVVLLQLLFKESPLFFFG